MGSSKKTNAGRAANSTPTEVLFRSPPDMPLMSAPPTIVSAQSKSPNSVSIRFVREFRSMSVVLLGSRSLAENKIASRGVEVTCNESSWATNAILFRTSILVGSTEKLFRRTSLSTTNGPPVLARPDKTFSSVLFPLPLGPMIAAKRQQGKIKE